MIHFSVSRVQANAILKALIHYHSCLDVFGSSPAGSPSECERLILQVLADVGAYDLRPAESASTNIEETQTREGAELCQRIS